MERGSEQGQNRDNAAENDRTAASDSDKDRVAEAGGKATEPTDSIHANRPDPEKPES